MIGIIFAFLLLGLVSGVLAGLFGIGGGLVVVPALVFIFNAQELPSDLVMIMAIATSLATIILMATSSVVAHHRLGSVLWDKVVRLTPGIMLGAMLGAVVADFVRTDVLRYIFIGYLLAVGAQMALDAKPKAGAANYSRVVDFCVAGVIGLVSALLGIGGGIAQRTLPCTLPVSYA